MKEFLIPITFLFAWLGSGAWFHTDNIGRILLLVGSFVWVIWAMSKIGDDE